MHSQEGKKTLLEAFYNDRHVEIVRYKLLVNNLSSWTFAWTGCLKNPKQK